jgi:hypothetical protein
MITCGLYRVAGTAELALDSREFVSGVGTPFGSDRLDNPLTLEPGRARSWSAGGWRTHRAPAIAAARRWSVYKSRFRLMCPGLRLPRDRRCRSGEAHGLCGPAVAPDHETGLAQQRRHLVGPTQVGRPRDHLVIDGR